MNQAARQFPVGFCFNSDEMTSAIITKDQRKYDYGWSNWSVLFEDLDGLFSDHYLGWIFCVNSENEQGDFIDYHNELCGSTELPIRAEWGETPTTTRIFKMLKEVQSVLSLRSSS
jgi:hypothetical protein